MGEWRESKTVSKMMNVNELIVDAVSIPCALTTTCTRALPVPLVETQHFEPLAGHNCARQLILGGRWRTLEYDITS